TAAMSHAGRTEQAIECLDCREVGRVPGSLITPGHSSVVVDHPAQELSDELAPDGIIDDPRTCNFNAARQVVARDISWPPSFLSQAFIAACCTAASLLGGIAPAGDSPARSNMAIWPHICAVWNRVQYIAGAFARMPSTAIPIVKDGAHLVI